MKLLKLLPVFVLAVFYQQNALASNVVFNFGYSLGGDKLATVKYLGGTSDSLSVGQGIDMALGYEIQHGASRKFATQFLYGFVYGGAGTSDGGVEWSSSYLQVAEFMHTSRTGRVGIGMISSMSPKATSYGVFAGQYDQRFADALGYVLIGELNTSHYGQGGMTIGMKYTSISYLTTTYNGVDVSSLGVKSSGSSLSFYVGWLF